MRDIYLKIFNILRDMQWHNKSEFCRPYSGDDRRLREMKENGWIVYEERDIRDGKAILYTQYKITNIFPAWNDYLHKNGIFTEDNTRQKVFI